MSDTTWDYLVKRLSDQLIILQTDHATEAFQVCESYPEPAKVIQTSDSKVIFYNC